MFIYVFAAVGLEAFCGRVSECKKRACVGAQRKLRGGRELRGSTGGSVNDANNYNFEHPLYAVVGLGVSFFSGPGDLMDATLWRVDGDGDPVYAAGWREGLTYAYWVSFILGMNLILYNVFSSIVFDGYEMHREKTGVPQDALRRSVDVVGHDRRFYRIESDRHPLREAINDELLRSHIDQHSERLNIHGLRQRALSSVTGSGDDDDLSRSNARLNRAASAGLDWSASGHSGGHSSGGSPGGKRYLHHALRGVSYPLYAGVAARLARCAARRLGSLRAAASFASLRAAASFASPRAAAVDDVAVRGGAQRAETCERGDDGGALRRGEPPRARGAAARAGPHAPHAPARLPAAARARLPGAGHGAVPRRRRARRARRVRAAGPAPAAAAAAAGPPGDAAAAGDRGRTTPEHKVALSRGSPFSSRDDPLTSRRA
jgi:hypothetical protein